MRQPAFINGRFYHIFNRGVDKRVIFLDEEDRHRFVHDLFEFNDKDAVLAFSQRVLPRRKEPAAETFGGLTSKSYRGPRPELKKRKLLVDIIAWALMPNHYHLLLRQKVDSGISLFMKKIGTGYTLVFNQKYERSGALFQGTYKAKPIDDDRYLRHLSFYIHANPLDLFKGGKGVSGGSVKDKMRFLQNYRWSSYKDFIGIPNVPSLLAVNFIEDLELNKDYLKSMNEWVRYGKEREKDISDIILD